MSIAGHRTIGEFSWSIDNDLERQVVSWAFGSKQAEGEGDVAAMKIPQWQGTFPSQTQLIAISLLLLITTDKEMCGEICLVWLKGALRETGVNRTFTDDRQLPLFSQFNPTHNYFTVFICTNSESRGRRKYISISPVYLLICVDQLIVFVYIWMLYLESWEHLGGD